jgi:hypothetical protein
MPIEMAARTCLLCGKPLSRIWAGTGEDFCSREHRNQYRLRRGMERLSEANHIATVMRRREQPKHIAPNELRAPGAVSPRGFLDPARTRLPQMVVPTVRPAGGPQLKSADRFVAPCAIAGDAGESRDVAAPRIPAWPQAVPRVGASLVAHVNCAPPMPARRAQKGAASGRPALVKWAGRVLPLAARLAITQQRAEFPMRAAKVPLCRGRALRVSTAAAFRIPQSMAPPIRFTPPQTNELPSPGAKALTMALPPAKVERFPQGIETEAQAMRLPPAPPPDFQRRFRWPEALEMSLEFRNAVNGHRCSTVPFGSPDESQSKERK